MLQYEPGESKLIVLHYENFGSKNSVLKFFRVIFETDSFNAILDLKTGHFETHKKNDNSISFNSENLAELSFNLEIFSHSRIFIYEQ